MSDEGQQPWSAITTEFADIIDQDNHERRSLLMLRISQALSHAREEGRQEERERLIPLLCESCAAGNVPFLVEPHDTNWTHEFVDRGKMSRGGCRASVLRRGTGGA